MRNRCRLQFARFYEDLGRPGMLLGRQRPRRNRDAPTHRKQNDVTTSCAFCIYEFDAAVPAALRVSLPEQNEPCDIGLEVLKL